MMAAADLRTPVTAVVAVFLSGSTSDSNTCEGYAIRIMFFERLWAGASRI
eukprot:SAG11_NODE_15373_length_580_cov_1.110187_2_plen_49_part_01